MTANSLGLTVSEVQSLFRGSTQMREIDRDRVDMLEKSIAEILKSHDEQLKDHEKRIRSTEKFGWQVTAVLAVAMALGWNVIKGLLK